MGRSLLAFAASVFSLELIARLVFGYGTPVLYLPHPTIEYMLAPNQDVSPFGNRQLVNEYGMRSPALPDAPERIMVFGDSVLNGGTGTDHSELATTILSDDKRFYGNVSADSWGPVNLSAWIDEYGTLEADAAILVLSSHDAYDLPTFSPLNPIGKPTSTPWFALPRTWPRIRRELGLSPTGKPTSETKNIAEGVAALEGLLDRLDGLPICLVAHETKAELTSDKDDGWEELRAPFRERGLPIVELSEWMKSAPAYRDYIHLTPDGQQVLAKGIRSCVDQLDPTHFP